MLTTPEEKENALAAAIRAGSLDRVRELVEDHNCKVTGPGPWNQLPLRLAAESGNFEVINYLVAKGASPDEKTLSGAIASGRPSVLSHFLDEFNDLELTSREYEEAFQTRHPDMLRFAFTSASDEGHFESPILAQDDDDRYRIIAAARNALASLDSVSLFDELTDAIRANSEGQMFYAGPDREYEYRHEILFRLMRQGTHHFRVVWDIVHQELFKGVRYAELDGYSEKPIVDALFCEAIRTNRNEAFYLLLQYSLPNFQQCIAVAQEIGNAEVAEYLARYSGYRP